MGMDYNAYGRGTIRMVKAFIAESSVIRSILKQTEIDSSVIDKIYATYSEDNETLKRIAIHTKTSSKLLETIANRPELVPRKAALLNPNLDYEVAFKIIVKNKSWGLIKDIAERKDVPSEAISACVNQMIKAKGIENIFLDEMAMIPKLSPQLIDLIVSKNDVTKYAQLLGQEYVTPELLEKIWKKYCNAGVEGHPGIANDYANSLAAETIGHRNFPVSILIELLQTERIDKKLFFVLPNIQDRVYKYLKNNYDPGITHDVPWSWVEQIIENGLPQKHVHTS